MFKEMTLLALAAVACHAGIPSQGISCGYMPENILSCSNVPALFSTDVTNKCKGIFNPCGRLTCLFTQAGLLKDSKVDKQKAREYFDSFRSQHPDWRQAVNHLQAACLGDKVLPAQGVFLDCPAFDMTHCAMTSFIRNVPASQWVQSAQCEATRLYAESCPICPNECFAAQVPNDSCHACLALPRSA